VSRSCPGSLGTHHLLLPLIDVLTLSPVRNVAGHNKLETAPVTRATPVAFIGAGTRLRHDVRPLFRPGTSKQEAIASS